MDFDNSRGRPLVAKELIGLADTNTPNAAIQFLAPEKLIDLVRVQTSSAPLEQGIEFGESAHRSGNFYGRVLSMAAV